MMEATTRRFQSANVRIPSVKSVDEDATFTTKTSGGMPDMSHVTSNIVLTDALVKLEEKVETTDSVMSILPELQKDSELVWQNISSCEVEPFALSNFNFTIPYMDMYEEEPSGSHEIRRPPKNSLWAQTGDDDMEYIEERTVELNKKKLEIELKRYHTFLDARSKSMIIPPRSDSAVLGDKVIISRPSSAANKPVAPPVEEIEPLEPIESVVVTEEQVFQDRVEQIGKTKLKLSKLVDYVSGHANRKIISEWSTVKEAFQRSDMAEVKMVQGPNGSHHPVKIKVLTLVKLTKLLASSGIQFKKKEIAALYQKLDVPAPEIERVRRLSAVMITLEATSNEKLKEICNHEITKLTHDMKERTIRLDQLQATVFPDDPKQLEFELAMIEKEKKAKRMIEDEENKKKMAYAEVVEQRRLKGIEDFQKALRTLQYPRGRLTRQREFVLREVIEYAKHVLSVEEEASQTVIDPAIIRNLGEDVFDFSNKDAREKDAEPELHVNVSQSFDGSEIMSPTTPSQNRPSSSKFRTNLRGVTPEQIEEMKKKPPMKLLIDGGRLLKLLIDAVALGKGLNGVSFKDVVELIQALSTTKIQAFARCHMKRWRYEMARKCWKKAFSATKGRVFRAWAAEAYKMGRLKHYCWRKIVAWRFFVKRLKERRHYFTSCFWPFYVWRRSVLASSTIKQKTKFLCGRVFPTLIMLRIFRAWSKYAKDEGFYNKKADLCKKQKNSKKFRESFLWLVFWVHRRKLLRRNWFKSGLMMCRRAGDRCVQRPFQVWYSWVQLKKRLNASIRVNCFGFRSLIMGNKDFSSDREVFYESIESIVGSTVSSDGVSSRKHSKATSSKATSVSGKGSPGKPNSRGSSRGGSRKKKSTIPPSVNPALVKRYGKRKLLKYDKHREFKWHHKQIRYDVSDEEDEGEDLPIRPASNTEHFVATGSEDERAGSIRNTDFPSRPGSGIASRPPTSQDGSRPPSSRRMSRPLTGDGGGNRPQSKDITRRSSRAPADLQSLNEDEKLPPLSLMDVEGRSLDETEYPTYDPVSDRLSSAFNKVKVRMPEYDPVGLFFRINPITAQEIETLSQKMDNIEIFALLETSFRYQKWALRVFNNLRKHAKVCRSTKFGLKKKRLSQLRLVFRILNDNLNRSLSADITTSVTEQLINEARIAKLDKFARRRELTDAIKIYRERQIEIERERIHAFKASLKSSSSVKSHESTQDKIQRDLRAMTPPTSANESVNTGKMDYSAGRKQLAKSTRPSNRRQSIKVRKNMESISKDSRSFAGVSDASIVTNVSSTGSTANILNSSTIAEAGNSIHSDLTEPPRIDFLFWDREDREIQFNSIQKLVAHGKRMLTMTSYCTDILSRGEDHILKLQAKKFLALSDLEADQELHTKIASEKESEFVAGFRTYAANILVNAVYKVQTEFQVMIVKSCMRQYFKALRLSMLLKRSKRMCARKQLVNWIRICRRLNCISKLTPKYWKCRKMWGFFNRWLKYFERSHMDATSSVIGRARRGWELRKGFADYLVKKRIILTCYHPTNKRLKAATADRFAVFQRWKQYIQDKIMYRLLKQFTEHKYKLTLLRKCLNCWRYSTLSPTEQLERTRNNPDCYAIRHLSEDMDQIIKRYMSRVRLSLPRKLKRINMRYSWCVRRDARKVLSFKKFINSFHEEVEERIEQENSMLLSAFEVRGSPQYTDSRHLSPMARIPDGTKFSDPVFSHYSRPFYGLTIPGGYLICKIRIALKGNAGLVGWQLFWDADKGHPINGPERGLIAGIGVVTHDVLFKPFDFLIGVEYIYEGNEISAIRFQSFKTGWTKYYGSKPSLTAVTTRFSAKDIHEKYSATLPIAMQYNCSGPEEEKDPSFPVAYIVGLLGMENSDRATCMGVVVRHTVSQSIFSYHWVDEGKDCPMYPEKPPLHELVLLDIEPWEEGRPVDDDEASITTPSTAEAEDVEGRPHTGNTNISRFPQLATAKPPTGRKGSSAFGAIGGSLPNPNNGSVQGKKISTLDDEKDTTESEDVFFDICRMRSVELKQLEMRTDALLRKIWANVRLRHSSRQESKLVGITVLKGIGRWFFEGLCRKLVTLAKHAEECRDLLKSIRSLNSKKNQGEARLSSLHSGLAHMKSVENQQSWYGKSFLGPQDRIQRKAYFENVADYEQSIIRLEAESKESAELIIYYNRRIRTLTPQLLLSARVFNNFQIKLLAGRQKYTLLERMTLEQLKLQLMGNDVGKGGVGGSSSMATGSSLTGAPVDPNLVTLSLEQVCASLESKRMEDENKNDGSVSSAGSSAHLRRTLTDEAMSMTEHSLDASYNKMQQSYPDGTFGKKLAEGRSVWESRRHVPKVFKVSNSLNDLAIPKKISLPLHLRQAVSTNMSPSLRSGVVRKSRNPLLKENVDIEIHSGDVKVGSLLNSGLTPSRRMVTIDPPCLVPTRQHNSIPGVGDILSRRAQAVLGEKKRYIAPVLHVEEDRNVYISDITEDDIRHQRDFEENIQAFLEEQRILELKKAEAIKAKEEFLRRKNLQKKG